MEAGKEVVKEECEEEVEPTSDLVYKLMHAKAEDEERTRWATPLGRVHGGQRVQSARGQRTRRYNCFLISVEGIQNDQWLIIF